MDGGRRDGGGERERARAPKKQPSPQQPHHLFLSLSLLLLPRPARSPDATWYRPYDRPPAHLNLILSPTLAETGSQAALPARAGRPQATSMAEDGGERMGGGGGGGGGQSAAACVGRVPRVMRVRRRRAWRAGQAVDGPATACDGSANYWVTIPGGTGGPGGPDQPGWGRRPGRRDRRAGAWAERMRAGQFAAMRVCVCVPRAPPARPPRPCSLSVSLSACLLLAVAVVAAAARAARARVNFMACFVVVVGGDGNWRMFDWHHDPALYPAKK